MIESVKAICPECKNHMDLSRYSDIKEGMVIECNHCGITLLARKVSGGEMQTEIIDEGK